jgi:hypothetical protein
VRTTEERLSVRGTSYTSSRLDTSIKKEDNTIMSKFKSNTNIPMIINEELN